MVRVDAGRIVTAVLFAIVWIVIWSSAPLPFSVIMILVGFGFMALSVMRAVRRENPQSKVGQPPEVREEVREVREFTEYTGYCPNCGSPVDRGQNFCQVCGRRVYRWPSTVAW